MREAQQRPEGNGGAALGLAGFALGAGLVLAARRAGREARGERREAQAQGRPPGRGAGTVWGAGRAAGDARSGPAARAARAAANTATHTATGRNAGERDRAAETTAIPVVIAPGPERRAPRRLGRAAAALAATAVGALLLTRVPWLAAAAGPSGASSAPPAAARAAGFVFGPAGNWDRFAAVARVLRFDPPAPPPDGDPAPPEAAAQPDLAGFSAAFASARGGIRMLGGENSASVAIADAAPAAPGDEFDVVASGASGGGFPDLGVFTSGAAVTMYLSAPSGGWTLEFARLQALATGEDPGLAPPLPLVAPAPAWPPALLRGMSNQGAAQALVVYGELDLQGRLRQLRVLRSLDDRLNAGALRALEQWRFRPASAGGVPIALRLLLGIPVRQQ